MSLIKLMNETAFDEDGKSTRFSEKFDEGEVDYFLQAQSEGTSLDNSNYSQSIRNRWKHFIRCQNLMREGQQDMSVTVATNAISRAYSSISEHFYFNEESKTWELLDGSRIEDGYSAAKSMLSLMRGGEMVIDESSWVIGNIASCLMKKFPDEYDPAFIAESMDVKIETVEIYRRTYDLFLGHRVSGVSFSHHKDVVFTKGLNREMALLVLEAAKRKKLNLRETKYLAKITASKIADGEEIFEITNEDVEESMHSVVKGVKKKFIIIKHNGDTYTIRGHLAQRTLDAHPFILQTYPTLELIKGKKTLQQIQKQNEH